jgi:seryl-tRNA synthetase
MNVVKLPDGKTAQFPADMSREDIRKALLPKTEPKVEESLVVKAMARMVADEAEKAEDANEAVSKAIAALNTKAEIKALSELVETLGDEIKKTRKSATENTEQIVTALTGLMAEMKLNRLTPFEITVGDGGKKTMRRIDR